MTRSDYNERLVTCFEITGFSNIASRASRASRYLIDTRHIHVDTDIASRALSFSLHWTETYNVAELDYLLIKSCMMLLLLSLPGDVLDD
jgi:hypothetical protein